MRKPATRSRPRAGISSSNRQGQSPFDTEPRASAQSQTNTADLVHCGRFWKSRRNRRECIEVTIRHYENTPFVDVRLHELNVAGQMRPTARGFSVGMWALSHLNQALGTALRKASTLGLTARSS
ncbi:hypothetical protein [Bradyrhizobium sp. SZCCHNR1093]|uniref:hypothetical protein n=1 Tax=Bradyrhizobium sp. SZCCHNR1093 TaxID=3057368 RepID=UPI0028EC6497|nr:hypothetical protein [Bradyrhizobium sp. SZCCHNR1093]